MTMTEIEDRRRRRWEPLKYYLEIQGKPSTIDEWMWERCTEIEESCAHEYRNYYTKENLRIFTRATDPNVIFFSDPLFPVETEDIPF